jgi:hypothetical protein
MRKLRPKANHEKAGVYTVQGNRLY